MNISDLRIFMAVYDSGNYSRAAEKVFISPQGVSKVIHRLESELECTLFIRAKHGVTPTKDAELVASYAPRMIESENTLKARLKNPFYSEKATLSVVFAAGILSHLSPKFRQQFSEDHPDIILKLFEYSDTEVDAALRSDMAELGLLSGPIDFSYYDAIPLFSHEVCAVMNKNHRLASKDTVSYRDFDGEILTFLGPKYFSYNMNMERLIREGAVPKDIYELEDTGSITNYAATSSVIGITARFVAEQSNESPIVTKSIEPRMSWDTYLIKKKGREMTPAAQAFVEHARSWIRQKFPEEAF